MIRDPSDGSVRGHHPKPLENKSLRPEGDVLVSTTSGLPTNKLKTEELQRLEKSREWLRARQQGAASHAISDT